MLADTPAWNTWVIVVFGSQALRVKAFRGKPPAGRKAKAVHIITMEAGYEFDRSFWASAR
jgi:hypothetical protein